MVHPDALCTFSAFRDDLYACFVPFTRAQHILLLFGQGNGENGPRPIRNVATGWTRDGSWRWGELGVQYI